MTTIEQKERLSAWFYELQSQILQGLESLEATFGKGDTFTRKTWKRSDTHDEGGGTMAIIEDGDVFERGGVNVSTVYGEFSPEFRKEIPGAEEDPRFWASGLSLVIHPRNPFVPIIHMNTRHIITSRTWFGGGIDLTPAIPFDDDTAYFHQQMKDTCDRHQSNYYPDFKKWCDEYFYLTHRQEPRGIGGIFYDYLNSGNFEADFAFTQDVGKSFVPTYTEIVTRHAAQPWTDAEKMIQLKKRGRYVEFNLLYDRGTRFGLKTNGNVEAILMSLPPMAHWGLNQFEAA